MSRSQQYREAVRAALAGGPLCESDIIKQAPVPGWWLAHTLLGLLHEGAVSYLGPHKGKNGNSRGYMWASVRKPSPPVTDIPDGMNE